MSAPEVCADACPTPAALYGGRPDCQCRQCPFRSHLLQRRTADSAGPLPGLSSPRRSGADVLPDLQRNAAVGEGDQGSRADPQDAAVVGRSALRQVLQRPLAVAGGDRHAGSVVRSRRRRGQSERCSAAGPVRRWLDHRQAGRGLRDAERLRCSGDRDDRVSVHRDPDRLHGRPLGATGEARPGNRQWCITSSRSCGRPDRNGCPMRNRAFPSCRRKGSGRQQQGGRRFRSRRRTAGGLRSGYGADRCCNPARRSWCGPAATWSCSCTTRRTASRARSQPHRRDLCQGAAEGAGLHHQRDRTTSS